MKFLDVDTPLLTVLQYLILPDERHVGETSERLDDAHLVSESNKIQEQMIKSTHDHQEKEYTSYLQAVIKIQI